MKMGLLMNTILEYNLFCYCNQKHHKIHMYLQMNLALMKSTLFCLQPSHHYTSSFYLGHLHQLDLTHHLSHLHPCIPPFSKATHTLDINFWHIIIYVVIPKIFNISHNSFPLLWCLCRRWGLLWIQK